MSKINISILGTGSTLASKIVSNQELEQSLNLKKGWIESHCGVKERYHIQDEESSDIGVSAALQAVEAAGIKLEDLDLVMGVSAIQQQAIPSMSAIIHKKLGLQRTQTFDVNSTCLSFLTGLSIAAEFIEGGRYNNILLVAAEISSPGLNPKDPKTATLFGDGAAAVVVGRSNNTSSHIQFSKFETWSESQHTCLFEAGGSKLHLKELTEKERYKNYFQMNGAKLSKAALPHVLRLVGEILEKNNTKLEDIDLFIPHQASPFALKLVHKLLNKKYQFGDCHFLNIVENFGNMIATSLPHALDYAIKNKLLKRGQKVLMLGTSAGLSIGGILFEY
jgi:3-oxoacyl-[acyl-carrier-protein] synthase III